ncbi:MAG: cytochrome P450 [Halioglobus sp.]|jgi:cytochrome P450
MDMQIPKVSNWRVFKNLLVIFKNPLDFHKDIYKQSGDSFIVNSLNGEDLIITRSSNVIQHVLLKNHKNYQKSRFQTVDLAKYVGHGLLTSNGEHWLTHRRMIQPGFGRKKLQGLLSIIRDAVTNEVECVEVGKAIDVLPLMSDLAFQTVAKGLFSAGDIRERMASLQKITHAAQKMLIKEIRQPYLRWWFRLSGSLDRHVNMGGEARGILNELVSERRSSGNEENDLLDMLLAARYEDGESMSDRQLLDEVMILFTAGHETTANALSFTLFHIAKDAVIQQRIFNEISDFDFGDDNLPNVFKDLTFTRQCIEEAMRLYPPAYMIDRVSIEDDEVDGYKIPAGTMFLLSLFELHRDEQYWKKSSSFDPDRFHPDQKSERVGRYFPFGTGPRMCVGNHFAMFEMIVAVAKMVKSYTLTCELDHIELVPLVSLKPKEVPIRFEKR